MMWRFRGQVEFRHEMQVPTRSSLHMPFGERGPNPHQNEQVECRDVNDGQRTCRVAGDREE